MTMPRGQPALGHRSRNDFSRRIETVAQPRQLAPGISRLRAWQRQALAAYEASASPRDFLVTATPGSGKTTFALALAAALIDRRVVERVVVVCPTDHLRTQWAEAAERAGIGLDPTL